MGSPVHKKGLYVPQLEKDACGTGLIANLDGIASHRLVGDALTILENMKHRGAIGADPNTGDGAGITVHIPHDFLRQQCFHLGFELPAPGQYGAGIFFLPRQESAKRQIKAIISECAELLEFRILGHRTLPVVNEMLGASARATEPIMEQIFMQHALTLSLKEYDRRLYLLRQAILRAVEKSHLDADYYCTALSSRIMIYKGQLSAVQLRHYFPDLSDPQFKSAIALVHSRFSTNTMPRWKLAQPFRCISHNGEINTIRGNLNWWNAKEKSIKGSAFTPDEMKILLPVTDQSASDSASFDNVLEFLVHNRRTIPHALMMMIPEAWQNNEHIAAYKKYFYAYHEVLMEPWDGPASICFTDGTLVGATLDRNGLRPSRYLLTEDNVLILASETGVLPVDPAKVRFRKRLEPGKILIADLDEHRIIDDRELKERICSRKPYEEWIRQSTIAISDLPEGDHPYNSDLPLLQRQMAFGMTREDRDIIVLAMARAGKEPIGSMGSDTPLAVLSANPQHLSNYFKQEFAQVTNPPVDPIREAEFLTLKSYLGGTSDFLDAGKNQVKSIRLKSPILTRAQFQRLAKIDQDPFRAVVLDAIFESDYRPGDLQARLSELCISAESHVRSGKSLLILRNTEFDASWVPIPALMITGAIHHHLLRQGLRQKVSLIVQGGDLFETHHFATLISFGADAIYPEVAIQTVAALNKKQLNGGQPNGYIDNYLKAVEKGLLKIMSKLGISTVLSYKGAQTFEALGIGAEVIDLCFTGTVSRLGGLGFDLLAQEALAKHQAAFFETQSSELFDAGLFQWKKTGEYHLFNPTTIHLLQRSTRTNNYEIYKEYTAAIQGLEQNVVTLRSLFDFKKRKSIPIEDVEPVENILRRFATGAMSFGSISHEAHSTLAIAMNRIGGKSNSGEGGEDAARYVPKKNGDSERSAIKQVASGRFGVTIDYLTNANEIQIKMAQGAKPGEGGQLPGHKVNADIARVRHTIPGVGLISPPPHHDIYSIEDLAQLIFDLKNANPQARISVKLVSKAGVGIIASGVVKGHADHVLIAGHDGGTGASPLSSIRHAGLPWELGIAETHQTLMRNGLRDRVTLQVDGQIRTGRDLAIATLLGAEEWGIATAALVVEGCVMMRKCHLNTCAMGIATQDKRLRKLFHGKPEHLVNYFHFLAKELRQIMAEIGFATINEMIGRTDALQIRKSILHPKAKSLDLSPILVQTVSDKCGAFKSIEQDHGIDKVLDRSLLEIAAETIRRQKPVTSYLKIRNTDRATGTLLSHEVTRTFGSEGLPEDTIRLWFTGSAGQSFAAFGAPGLRFTLEGDANDYLGKGLSGAKLIVIPDARARYDAHENVIVGNVALYGATTGTVYIRGIAGERFCVRNSGVLAVVEGLGAHGCEYMTGGMVVVLGPVGRNFGAGMSGGIAMVYDVDNSLRRNCNSAMVDLETPTEMDLNELCKMVTAHYENTGSKKAVALLQHWEVEKRHFVKVMPHEYKAILMRKKLAKPSQQMPAEFQKVASGN